MFYDKLPLDFYWLPRCCLIATPDRHTLYASWLNRVLATFYDFVNNSNAELLLRRKIKLILMYTLAPAFAYTHTYSLRLYIYIYVYVSMRVFAGACAELAIAQCSSVGQPPFRCDLFALI